MSDDLDKYLGKIAPYVGFQKGFQEDDVVAELAAQLEQSGRAGQGAVFAFGIMRTAWRAMPPSVRDAAREILEDALENALSQISEGIGDIPVAGWIADIVIQLFKAFGEAKHAVDENNEAWSLQQYNERQVKTFLRAKHPTDWVWARENGELYMHYGGGVDYDRWRERPALPPVTGQARVVGFPVGNPTSGLCSPGKPFRNVGDNWYEKDKSPRCSYSTQFSSLFYPFWSPAVPAQPLPYYGIEVWPKNAPFKDVGEDPNKILIERQALLIGDPVTNLQASGKSVQRRLDGFLSWFKFALKPGVKVDPTFVNGRDAYHVKDAPTYYLDKNGLMHPYAGAVKAGVASIDHVIAEKDGVRVTSAIYSCIVGMCRAFFTARAAFLGNMDAMKVFVEQGLVNTFDPNVRSAVKAASKPRRKPKTFTLSAKKVGSTGSGGAVAVVAGGSLLALLLKLRG